MRNAPHPAGYAPSGSRLHVAGLWLAYAVAVAALLTPLAVVTIPPLVDYPNHLARLHILAAIEDEPTLQGIYEVRWAILPNLAMDLIALPFAKLLGAVDAGRLFVAITIVLLLGGTATLHRVLHGRFGLWPLCAALVVYNYCLFWGFLSYLFTAGLVLFAFAGWIAAERWLPWTRGAVFSLVSVALFICHLFAFATFGLIVAAYELWRWRERREAGFVPFLRFSAPAAAQFGIPAVLWFMSPTGTGAAYTDYGGIMDKMRALISPVVFSGGIVERVIFVFAAFVIIWGIHKRWYSVTQKIAYPLVALALAAIAMPNWLMNTFGADLRLPVVIACVFIAGARPTFTSRRTRMALATVAVFLFATRMVLLTDQWRETDRRYAEFRQAAREIPEGSAILPTWTASEGWVDNASLPYWHLATLAVIDRSAFVPTLFTNPVKQPVRVRDLYRDIDANHGDPISLSVLTTGERPETSKQPTGERLWAHRNAYWQSWQERFDYVLVVRDGPPAELPPGKLVRVSGGSWFDIYRVIQ